MYLYFASYEKKSFITQHLECKAYDSVVHNTSYRK